MLALGALIAGSFCVLDDETPAAGEVVGGLETPVPTRRSSTLSDEIAAQSRVTFDEPARWTVRYFGDDAPDQERFTGDVAHIDLSFPGGAFDGFRDNAWKLVAESEEAPLAAGKYRFRLITTAEVHVFVNDVEFQDARGTGREQNLSVQFEHGGGPVRIRIEAADRVGPFALRWVTP
jgi:hypothetical protein